MRNYSVETVNSLINEYLAITGRPAATLSVSEFMAFKEYASKEALSTTREVSLSVPNVVSESKKEIAEPKKVVSQEDTKKIVKLEANNQPRKKKKNNILSMLKSVPG